MSFPSHLKILNVISIVALLSHPITAQSPDSASTERLSWYSAPNYRGTLDLVWTCVLTIFLCCWTAIHPDIPQPGLPEKHRWLDRTICLLIGTVAPEIFIYLAFIERWSIRSEYSFRPHNTSAKQWTIAHLFYARMGGFCVRWRRPGDDEESVGYLPSIAVYELLRDGFIPSATFPTASDIRDKGKADGIIKAFTLLQILWVLVQSIARGIQHLPLTTLEISTLAYIPCACAVFWLWWDKPYDICVPTLLGLPEGTVVLREGQIAGQVVVESERSAFAVQEYRAYNMTKICWEDAIVTTLLPINRSGFISGVVFLVVGSIHLAAWNFDFPSEFEKWAWRVCSLVITTSIPTSWLVTRAVLKMMEWVGVEGLSELWFEKGRIGEGEHKGIRRTVVGIQGIGVGLYGLARLYLLVEVFLSLRAVLPGVYETPDWTMFIPHIQ